MKSYACNAIVLDELTFGSSVYAEDRRIGHGQRSLNPVTHDAEFDVSAINNVSNVQWSAMLVDR